MSQKIKQRNLKTSIKNNKLKCRYTYNEKKLSNCMSYYKHHIFFCTNQRTDGRVCCQDHNAQELRDYLKMKVKEAGLSGPNKIRVNNAGCLDRCGEGPVLVIYPEETWYQYQTKEDLDEILNQHVLKTKVVKRLII